MGTAASVCGLIFGIAGIVVGLLVARWGDGKRRRMLELAGSQGSTATIIVEVLRADGEIKRYPVNPEEEEGIRNLLRAAEDARVERRAQLDQDRFNALVLKQ